MPRRSELDPISAAKPVVDIDRAVAAIPADIPRHTPAQHRARAALWAAVRADATFDPANLKPAQLAGLAFEPRIVEWIAEDPGFKKWICSPRDLEEHADALYSEFLEGLTARRAGMADKDYLNALKLLAEVANKMPSKWQNTKVLDEGVSQMSDEARIQLMADTLRRLGWVVAPRGDALPAATPDAETAPAE